MSDTLAYDLPPDHEQLSSRWQKQLIWAFLILGVAARCIRYFLRFPLWEDECFLAVNFIDRGYLDLLKPLHCHQAAPLLFLWLELTAVKLLGYSEMVLRLFPFLLSVGALFLFRYLASRLLSGTALLLAVAVLSVGYPGIRYATEAKPYGSDLFVSLVLLTLAVQWWQRPGNIRWLWGLVVAVPLALGLSHPAVFIAGAISIFVALVLWSGRQRRGWLAWIVYNVVILGSFGLLFYVSIQGQKTAELSYMQEAWHSAFVPLTSAIAFVKWFLLTHVGESMAYPVGGERGASSITFLFCIMGLALLWQTRRWALMVLCLTPAALQFVAAAMKVYPYGGHIKFFHHVSPLIAILVGLGASAWLGWWARKGKAKFVLHSFRTLVILLAAVGIVLIVRDVTHPCKTKSDLRARAFAQWFWPTAAFQGEVACVTTDLGQDFSPEVWTELTWAAMYVCNKRIYSSADAWVKPPDWERISDDWPLRCVVYRVPHLEFDEQALARWLKDMQSRYKLLGRESYPFPRYDRRQKRLVTVDYIDIYKFVPK